MLSRTTILALLLTAMTSLAIATLSYQVRDSCNTYPEGGAPPRSEYAVSGTRQVEIPCTDWWMRQTQAEQILCLVAGALGSIFVVGLADDLRRKIARRHARGKAGG